MQGADAVRWYFYSNSAPWLPNRFHAEAVSESARKFMGTLWNTYAFYVLYAEIDKFDPTKYTVNDTLCVMDAWILSRLNTTVKSVTDYLNEYKIYEATKDLTAFTDELSNWYVRRCRERFWASDMNEDKVSAYMTLYTVLETFCRLITPFVPFVSESIYSNIVCSVDKTAPASIHLTEYPVCDDARVNTALEDAMNNVLRVVVQGRACRNASNIKNRQPLGKLYVAGVKSLDEGYIDIIKAELNVKEVSLGAAAEEYIKYEIKPQLRTVGPKYGKLLGGIKAHLSSVDGGKIVNAVKSGVYAFDVNGNTVELTEDDILIELTQKEGYAVQADGDLAVILDTELTDALVEEGFVREIISKIQTMRKEAGFEVTDHIALTVAGGNKVSDIAAKYKDTICSEVLANRMDIADADGFTKTWDINGFEITMGVKLA